MSEAVISAARLAQIDGVSLQSGGHSQNENFEMCVMEAL